MRISAIGGILTVSFEERFDIVVDEDTGMRGCERAVEFRFVEDGVEEGERVACCAESVEGTAGVGGSFIWRGLGEGGECASGDVGDDGCDAVEGIEGGGAGGAVVEEEELGFGDAGEVGGREDDLGFRVGVGGGESICGVYNGGDGVADEDLVASLKHGVLEDVCDR